MPKKPAVHFTSATDRRKNRFAKKGTSNFQKGIQLANIEIPNSSATLGEHWYLIKKIGISGRKEENKITSGGEKRIEKQLYGGTTRIKNKFKHRRR